MQTIRSTFVFLLFSTVLFGGVYPAVSTLIVQGLFPDKAEGSLIIKDGKVLGSKFIGQNFTEPQYFWSRLSATAPYAYNAGASTGSNLGTANPALLAAVKARAEALEGENIPVDLVTASGSGLDPHISPAAAEYQIKRVAQARNMQENELRELVTRYTEGRQFGILGEPRVNVLMLNLALDGKL